MPTRRVFYPKVKRWFWSACVGLLIILGSVAYVQFNQDNHANSGLKNWGYDGRKLLEDVQNKLEKWSLARPRLKEIEYGITSDKNVEYGQEIAPPGVEPHPNGKSAARKRKPGQVCPVPVRNPVKSTFDVSEMTYSLKRDELYWDGDAGVWDADIEKRYQTVRTQ